MCLVVLLTFIYKLSYSLSFSAESLSSQPRETATHLALTAVQDLLSSSSTSGPNANAQPVTVEAVTARVRAMLPNSFEGDAEFPSEEVEHAIGEVYVLF